MANKWNAEQMVQRAIVFIMQSKKWVSYSGVAMVGETKVVDNIPTAMTDGLNKFFGREFIDGLNDKQVRGVVLHETLHVMYRHLVTWINLFKEDAKLANIAADYIVNGTIMEAQDPNVELPSGAIYDPTITTDKYNVYDVFQMLKSGKLANPMSGGGCSGNCKASSSADGTPSGQCSCPVGFDEHDWQASQGMSDEEQKQAREAIDSAIRQGAILAGKMAGDQPRDIGDLMKVKIDWVQVLREWLTSRVRGGDESTWNRPARRWIGQDIYMPSQYTTSMGEVVIAIDTSGSISGPFLTLFLSHVMRIVQTVKPESCRILYWDAKVQGDELYRPEQYDQIPSSTRVVGGGGTVVSSVSDYLNANQMKPQCVVILTDGYLGSDRGSNWPAPVIWCVKGDDNFTAPNGAVLALPEDLS
jgi:predicted metal-dependent peptidase